MNTTVPFVDSEHQPTIGWAFDVAVEIVVNGVYNRGMKTHTRTVLITGASRGIGYECALALASPSTHLVLHARTVEALHDVATQCRARGAQVHLLPLDLGNVTAIQNRIATLVNEIGPIHTLINNAGIWIEEPFDAGNMELWDQALNVNLNAVIHLCRYSLDQMPDDGAVVFIASTASKRSYAKGTNYCAAKFGVMGFAGALFEDVRERGIKVCSIFPGVVNTDMHANDPSFDTAKMIQPEDVAQAVVYALNTPKNICPTEIVLQPQQYPKHKI